LDNFSVDFISGGKMYHDECAGCHGIPGKPQNVFGASLFPAVPQLATVGTEYSEAQAFWVAKHGIRRTGMFANGKWDSDEHLWTITAYIKRMNALPAAVKEALEPKKAVAGDSKDASKQ
jgi:mono/diheme cytochrome c family protein